MLLLLNLISKIWIHYIFFFFLGIQITKTASGLYLSQTKYIQDLLVKTEMLEAKACDTPCLPYNKLLKDDRDPYANPGTY